MGGGGDERKQSVNLRMNKEEMKERKMGGRHAPSLEKQAGVPTQKLSNVLLWTGEAAQHILDT